MNKLKGIILAGGYGSRLYPLTLGTSKQLLPVYDKPMIYYPLSIFMMSGIKEILIISTDEDSSKFKKLLGDGHKLGIEIKYQIQQKPNGIAESFIIGSDFIGNDNVSLILGDNIFHGENFMSNIKNAKENLINGFSTIFGVKSKNPENFGVVEFNQNLSVSKIVEKPLKPKSNTIVSGLYFYTKEVIEIANNLTPSKRGEKEITDVNNFLLKKNKLKLSVLDDTTSWIDTGTYSSLIKASKFFENLEIKTGKKASCIEEIALKMNYINDSQLLKIAESMKNSEYGKYLYNLIK
jgi:glucose-1-phosphate thymidylyltransferase